ncbi:mold-specific m46 protein [Colletotrichum truncatum]|uniref:Mold-specific m46 protein n=1 Tax=Colletotrichum truncatum TaxID=5467 RepID=A0ACC3YZK3_COLTU|nr:mold-specific m46 protein [Colletotrichum truncatum]XP_036578826.1 mold-specific m46 protein [Colletotrichum truncatum]KAF6780712.1 mold-specific m46 protein [Colletotrichum truncatum]KAF6786209.1 mold-specific m46 protein [Colletotrichum truncatum]
MRFHTIAAVLVSVATAQAAVAQGQPQALTPRGGPVFEELVEKRDGPFSLQKRECKYNGCKCNSRGLQLTICGACKYADTKKYAISAKRVDNHIYECSPGGKCCDYGYAKDCGKSNQRCIIN